VRPARLTGSSPEPTGAAPRRLGKPATLTARSDFLRAAGAARHSAQAFLLQARKRSDTEPVSGYRLGITCSRKVGNAVARNRARRRLREVARLVLPESGLDGWDYVLVGRAGVTATHPFTALQDDLRRALARLHASAAGDRPEGQVAKARP